MSGQDDDISTMVSPLVRPGPSEFKYKHMRFLITDRPADNKKALENFIKELKKRNVYDLVRVCEPTYNAGHLKYEGITVYDFPFDDGSAPSPEVIEKWFQLLRDTFSNSQRQDPCVAVHCVAGLGRAPVLVALALMELGMKYEDAVETIREKRRGAINSKQLAFLASYRPKQRLKDDRSSQRKKKCVVQ